ncbi:uncharacterized protein (TIGR03086 family) [Jatrophihabitans sp. GAS493]|uniref:TIGR03086 family metal-binding protein n=1 Tax=Jatrophihabitans sp. GAS493 TaxID=1907575 RepID=UPI000BB9A5C9|nr:TIGR03086 family metal-binding protein [Jatrophihabitans sp. GAS493]SOD70869.1 uncharacterized protein (TIGR03086 family) [Jatrophihabitans sp. GAS493]
MTAQLTTFDPRLPYAQATAQTELTVAGIRPEQFGLPTPCDEYDVRTLVGHMIGGMNRIAHVGRGGDCDDVEPQIYGVPDEQLLAEFRQARLRTVAVWSPESTLDAMAKVPWGVVPGRIALGGYVMEILTHGWDLAVATGQPSEGAPELAELALGIGRMAVPAEARQDPEMPFDTVIEVPDEAGAYARLAGWLGRKQ